MQKTLTHCLKGSSPVFLKKIKSATPFSIAIVEAKTLKLQADNILRKQRNFEKNKKDYLSNLEKNLLNLIPKQESHLIEILKIKGLRYNGSLNESLLSILLKRMLDEENYSLNKENCLKFFKIDLPLIIEIKEIKERLSKINYFWSQDASLEFSSDDIYYYFTLKRLV